MNCPPRAPIVLVHGVLGFDRVKVGPYTLLRYFPQIEEVLTAAGFRVGVPNLAKTRGVAHRAEQLRRFILDTFPNDCVHVVAHSMGGLDARYMISRLGMEDRVRSLTTVGTPHRGAAFADWAVRRLSRSMKPLCQFWGITTEAFEDLTTESCARFNAILPEAPGVRYFSVAGRCERKYLPPLWWAAAEVISGEEGPNDGVVSVASAEYGEAFEVWDGDHMNLVNRANPRGTGWGHRPTDYLRLVARLERPAPTVVSPDWGR
jgi:triacylglycerol lipase